MTLGLNRPEKSMYSSAKHSPRKGQLSLALQLQNPVGVALMICLAMVELSEFSG